MVTLISILDADDVLLNTGKAKVVWIRRNLNYADLEDKLRTVESINPWECNRTDITPIIGHENYERMGAFVYSREGTLPIQPIDGALQGVAELSSLGEIYVLSARKPEFTENVKEWLNNNGFYRYIKHDNVSSVSDPRYKDTPAVADSKKVGIAVEVGADMFVDDDRRHMPKEFLEGLQCLLFGETERKDIKPYIRIARNWGDVILCAREIAKYKTG